jgi:curved DNA-binding protein
MFGGRSARGGGRRTAVKGQDFNAEFHLDLKRFTTHKRTPPLMAKHSTYYSAGVENGQL